MDRNNIRTNKLEEIIFKAKKAKEYNVTKIRQLVDQKEGPKKGYDLSPRQERIRDMILYLFEVEGKIIEELENDNLKNREILLGVVTPFIEVLGDCAEELNEAYFELLENNKNNKLISKLEKSARSIFNAIVELRQKLPDLINSKKEACSGN